MPKVAVCPNGHHYDAEKYATCPHCESMNERPVMPTPSVMEFPKTEVKKRRSIFDASRKHSQFGAQPHADRRNSERRFSEHRASEHRASEHRASEHRFAENVQPDFDDPSKTVPLFAQDLDSTVPLYTDAGETVALFPQPEELNEASAQPQASAPQTSVRPEPEPEPETPAPAPEGNLPKSGLSAANDDMPAKSQMPEPPAAPEENAPGGMSDLQKAVQATNSGAVRLDTKTIGFFNIDEDPSEPHREPTVGWIVCVKGAHKGDSFPLRYGRNSIGRSDQNDVVLKDEMSVSRDKHAHIVFDPINCAFLLQPGDGHGLTYKNGEVVMTFAQLQSYDRLLFGQAEFVFVAFCGDKFKW